MRKIYPTDLLQLLNDKNTARPTKVAYDTETSVFVVR